MRVQLRYYGMKYQRLETLSFLAEDPRILEQKMLSNLLQQGSTDQRNVLHVVIKMKKTLSFAKSAGKSWKTSK
jgi:hypothetical protein